MPKNARNTKPSRKSKIVRVDPDNLPEGVTDWARVDAKTDEDIARDVASDPDAEPWTDEMFANAVWVEPRIKLPISIRIDPDVLDFFKKGGSGYQSRINSVLRSYMNATESRSAKKRRAKARR
jgi:uncharacterized protein (DUF4415 family)